VWYMFERYSTPSRRTVFYARAVALNDGAAEIDSMHLLCGLIVEKSSQANALFKLKERFPEESARIRRMKWTHEQKDLRLTDDSKRILAFTAEEANQMDDYWIDTDHLVLGILREGTCTAATRLEASGLTIEQARAQVSSSAQEPHEYSPAEKRWWPSMPTTIGGQIAAASYVLLIVVLLKLVTEASC
jgi:ATP-dependent Clp protease ATP-binding subunit ClpC